MSGGFKMKIKGELLLVMILVALALLMAACAPEPESDPGLDRPAEEGTPAEPTVEVPEETVPAGRPSDDESVGEGVYDEFYEQLPVDDNLAWFIRKF
jgi:hypothetical protein